MPATDHLPGTLGPYRLQDRLGEGGMGVVHLARDPEGRAVAVKVLHPLGSEVVNARRRLAREVETMRRVRSPYVAEVIDADLAGDTPYIVTRYVAGPTLDQVVTESGPLPPAALFRLACGLADALTAVHAAGVVHRDLKPSNVMMLDEQPVVIDFGIAQGPDATRLTLTGMFMGTPGYLAPEVIEGEPSSPASDVHSWGSTMAFAATGHLPFGAGSYETIFYRIISGRADLSGVPGPLVPLISAALARDPSHRPSASWLSAQAVTLDMSAGTATTTYNGVPATETQYPREAVVIPAVPPAAPQAGPQAAAARVAPPPAPRQAARDVADLLPPVSYPPAGKQQPYQDQAGPWGPEADATVRLPRIVD